MHEEDNRLGWMRKHLGAVAAMRVGISECERDSFFRNLFDLSWAMGARNGWPRSTQVANWLGASRNRAGLPQRMATN